MKRIFLLLLGLGLGVFLIALGWNTWKTAKYFQNQGREATLVIGKRYNAERWSSPLPIKKVYSYTAKLEPKYEVLIETDQDIREGETRSIRFLTRDLAESLRDYAMRPVVNSMRLRDASDGTPVKIEDTALFDALVDKWMGPPAAGVYIRPRARPEAAPDTTKATVPFVFATPDDGTWGIVWTNSRAQEWLLLGIGLLGVQSLLIAAYDRHKDARLAKKRGPKFVHPSLRKIEAAPPAEPVKKLTYVPKPDEEIVLPESEKRRLAEAAAARAAQAAAPAPSSAPANSSPSPAAPAAAATPAPSAPESPADPAATKAPDEPTSLLANETAPPLPVGNDVVLKLRRRSGGDNNGGDKPAPPDSGKSAG
jgi:Predicted membrane protein